MKAAALGCDVLDDLEQRAPDMATSTSIEALWAAMRKTREDTSPSGMIRAMYGTTSRGGPDTRAAAEDLGVSQRTVQRWLKSGLPRARSAAADALTGGYQAWRNTATARRSQLSTRRESRLRNKGTTMVFYGKIAVSADPRNTTRRSTTVDISAANMNRILDATSPATTTRHTPRSKTPSVKPLAAPSASISPPRGPSHDQR